MKAYIIQMSDNDSSLARASVCEESVKKYTDLEIVKFEATQPDLINTHKQEVFGTTPPEWTWASDWVTEGMDILTGLYKRPYEATDQKRVIACALSHYRLWKLCAEGDEPICVLEHDARFTREFSMENFPEGNWGAVGLNDPRGNTRKGTKFHSIVEAYGEGLQRVPVIDEPTEPPLPMGLAGNSAYLLKPSLAGRLLAEVRRVGMWPNDAIMCRQLFPSLKVVYPYYTDVQRGVSTTTAI